MWEKEAAQQKASSKVCLRRKPPKIMKLWRFRYCGCIIWEEWSLVLSMYMMLCGLRISWFGSVEIVSILVVRLDAMGYVCFCGNGPGLRNSGAKGRVVVRQRMMLN